MTTTLEGPHPEVQRDGPFDRLPLLELGGQTETITAAEFSGKTTSTSRSCGLNPEIYGSRKSLRRCSRTAVPVSFGFTTPQRTRRNSTTSGRAWNRPCLRLSAPHQKISEAYVTGQPNPGGEHRDRPGARGIHFGKGVKADVAAILRRLHQNLGHPSPQDLARHLRLAGVRQNHFSVRHADPSFLSLETWSG